MTTDQQVDQPEVPKAETPKAAEAPKRVTEEDAVSEVVAVLDRAEADGVSSLAVLSRVALRKGIKFMDVVMNSLEAGFGTWAKKA